MRQEFHETLSVSAPPEAVWRTVREIPAVLGWISIVRGVTEVEPVFEVYMSPGSVTERLHFFAAAYVHWYALA